MMCGNISKNSRELVTLFAEELKANIVETTPNTRITIRNVLVDAAFEKSDLALTMSESFSWTSSRSSRRGSTEQNRDEWVNQ
jgi:hypothetical protein